MCVQFVASLKSTQFRDPFQGFAIISGAFLHQQTGVAWLKGRNKCAISTIQCPVVSRFTVLAMGRRSVDTEMRLLGKQNLKMQPNMNVFLFLFSLS